MLYCIVSKVPCGSRGRAFQSLQRLDDRSSVLQIRIERGPRGGLWASTDDLWMRYAVCGGGVMEDGRDRGMGPFFPVMGESGQTVLDILRARGLSVEAPCGGLGRCGACRVLLKGDAMPPDDREKTCLGETALGQGYRLACRCIVHGSAMVALPSVIEGPTSDKRDRPTVWKRVSLHIPWNDLRGQGSFAEALRNALLAQGVPVDRVSRSALLAAAALWIPGNPGQFQAIVRDGVLRKCLEPGRVPLGIACDLGTSTVALYVVDLLSGNLRSVVSAPNRQRAFGTDVISRMAKALEGPKEHAMLCRALRQEVGDLVTSGLEAAHGVPEDVLEVVVAGNPPMTHAFWGYVPGGLSREPFVPVERSFAALSASDLGLPLEGDTAVKALPLMGGYVGGDTVAMLLVAGEMLPSPGRLFIDFGTNGEIALMAAGKLWVTSAAAGPAFEGGHVTQGMTARPGAISRVSLQGDDFSVDVLGGGLPVGLCGSGLLDAVAVFRKLGVLDTSGRLAGPEDGLPDPLNRRLVVQGRERGVCLASGAMGNVVLWQRDIRAFQLAKAALQVGVQMLLDAAALKADALDSCILAGAFGAAVDPASIQAVGILPRTFQGTIRAVGDAAGDGALKVLLEGDDADRRARELADSAILVPLVERLDFQDRFLAATALP